MSKKIKPKFRIDGENQEDFQKEIEELDYAKAVSICRRPRDEHGHSETLSFRVNPMYPRLASELFTREPMFRTISDFHRTAYRLGCGVIQNVMKSKGKIGDQVDDLIIAVDELEKITKTDEAYCRLDAVLNAIPQSLKVYKRNPNIFKKKLSEFKEQIQKLKDPFWRDLLMKKFNHKLRYIEEGQNGFDSFDSDDQL